MPSRHEGTSTDGGDRLAPQFRELQTTLQLVSDTIVESLGFDVAVINLVEDETSMVVRALTGPPAVRDLLLGRRQGLDGWNVLMEASENWGRLRFLDHATSPAEPADVLSWIPDIPIRDDPQAWHPEDALFAPLVSTDGALIGTLSVDCPRDGKRPGPVTLRALEAYAVTASLAIQHATLAEDARRRSLQVQAVFDDSPVAIALLRSDGAVAQVNDALCDFLQRSPEELLGLRFAEIAVPPDSKPAPLPVIADNDPQRDLAPSERRFVRPDGYSVWGRVHLARIERRGSEGSIIAQIEDITERKQAEALLLRQAHYDSLTSLLNRTESMSQLRDVLARDAIRGDVTAVFFCDLDRLKLINDGHGHAAGDTYIREVGNRIRCSVREGDVVGRLSGDEFVVIVGGISHVDEAVELASRVVEAVRQPLSIGPLTLSPSLSLGIACSENGEFTADELLARADSAMYLAKLEDRGAWHVDDPSARESPAARLQLRTDVSQAIQRGELELYYQPIVNLSDRTVIGHEALLRWRHPVHGLLVPAQFLDVILDSEYESPVTDWALRQACVDAMRRPRHRRGVSVNVSSLQVGRRDLPEVVSRCLRETGLEPKFLTLELTEDRLLSRSDGAALLERLRVLGVHIAIDDFGVGFAGLGYLQQLSSVTVLKLDRSFIAQLGESPVSEHIVRAVVGLAAGCGLFLVTEGVETEAQAELLRALGVHHAQGYLFGRPAPWHEEGSPEADTIEAVRVPLAAS